MKNFKEINSANKTKSITGIRKLNLSNFIEHGQVEDSSDLVIDIYRPKYDNIKNK